MVLFNYATKELTAKIVYYGPGLCGKTTNLQFIHQNLPETVKGKMLSLATKTDRTLFFDFLPLDLGEIRGMKTRVQLYTVPGQVFYNETRKLVLKGVDGVVFVADSQKEMLGPNVESFKNLEENLKGHGLQLSELPHVIQFNKRDLPKLASIDEINSAVNKYNAPFYESVATTGIGVKDSLNAITKLVLLNLTRKFGSTAPEAQPAVAPTAPETVPLAAAPASPSPASPALAAAPPSPPPEMPAEPVAVAATAVTVGPADELPDEAPATTYATQEIDDLVGEVQAADLPTPDVTPEIPIVDAAPTPTEEAIDDAEAAAPPMATQEPDDTATVDAGEAGDAEITLTEVASDDDLFDDPNLEVARLAAGQAREIVIPVEVGDADTGIRRYKLGLRLRLDPVD
jgi:signal recognition particle receptor subunit beta